MIRISGTNSGFDAQEKAVREALAAQEKAVTAAMNASDRAVTKAEVASEKRLDSMNEFRGAYKDIIAQQMPRLEAEQRMESMAREFDLSIREQSVKLDKVVQRVESIEKAMANQAGRMWAFGTALGGVVIVVNLLIAIFWR